MNEYDRLVDILNKLCKFCPVCAKELKLVKAQAEIKNSGDQDSNVSWYFKSCPDGHGSIGVDYRWGTHDGNPDALFEFDPNLFKICGHCGESMKGYASAAKEWLCHPDEGMDCYRLVTVYNHPADAAGNCERCQKPGSFDQLRYQTIGKATVEEDAQGLDVKMTFFDQVREVQEIVDEANKKEEE
jgi:hypothetical protein